MARGSKPGERRGGRQKGTPNKVTATAREAIEIAAEELGGASRLAAWAKQDPANERAFWTSIYPKLLPLQVTGRDGEALPQAPMAIINLTRTADPGPSRPDEGGVGGGHAERE